MAGASVTKTAELLGFSRATIKDHDRIQEARKTLINQSKSGCNSKLTDINRRALKHILRSKHDYCRQSNSRVKSNIGIVQFQAKMFAVSSIKPDIMEKSPWGNHCLPLSRFRWGWSDVEITRADLQINGSKWYLGSHIMKFSLCHCCLAWLDQQQRLPEHFGRSSSSNDPGIIPWWWRHFPIRQRSNTYIHTWYEEHKSCIEHIEWPQQSPDLNIIENMWCVLERQVRNCYPPLPCLKELEQVSMEKWLQIPLYEVRKLYDSFPIRIKAVQKVGERQPYIK